MLREVLIEFIKEILIMVKICNLWTLLGAETFQFANVKM